MNMIIHRVHQLSQCPKLEVTSKEGDPSYMMNTGQNSWQDMVSKSNNLLTTHLQCTNMLQMGIISIQTDKAVVQAAADKSYGGEIGLFSVAQVWCLIYRHVYKLQVVTWNTICSSQMLHRSSLMYQKSVLTKR